MLVALVNDYYVVGLFSPKDEEEVQRLGSMYQAVVDITDLSPQPTIGWYFDGAHLMPQNGDVPIDWRITRLSFRRRFTVPELVSVLEAAKVNAVIEMLLGNLNIAEYIDLSDSSTAVALGVLVQAGLLTAERMQEILTTIPNPNELWFNPGG